MTPQELKAWRDRLGWPQQRLADALGMTDRQVYRWEHGKAPIPKWLPLALATLERGGP